MTRKPRQLPDQETRHRIASDLDQTLLVEAAAGTGKTTCLISRMVGLLREGKCTVDTMAAVTFTRKAAAELRTRFQLALEDAATTSKGIEHDRLANASHSVERCFIATIHSLCARLLRERPVEAGVDPGFQELDESLDLQLRQQAWRQHVANLIATDDPILPELERLGLKINPATRFSTSLASELDELGLEPAELGPAFMRYAEFPDVEDWPAEPTELPDLRPCIQALQAYAVHINTLQLPDNYGNDKLIPRYQLLARMVRTVDLEQPSQLMEVLEQCEARTIVQKEWPGKKAQALAEQQRWNDFLQQYADPLKLAWRIHRYEPVMRAIRPARQVYDCLRRDRNALNFQDLLLKSLTLLRDHPEIRSYFRSRFTHLLVDEFQDTDPLQAEIMLLLTADDIHEKEWENCRPVPGSLFVVGDPKQSIYRFRRADIQTYNKVRSIIQQSGGDVFALTANFRSVKPVIEWINDFFSTVFPTTAGDYSPANCPLQPGRIEQPGHSEVVQRLLIPAGAKHAEAAELEADWIARTIHRAINERWEIERSEEQRKSGLPPHARLSDFLIVARTTKRLAIYARKLQQYGIAHTVTGGTVLNEIPELQLLHLCLRAVTRPDDQLALVAVLRSELFGVADTALYSYRRAGGYFSYHSMIPSQLDSDEAAIFESAFERLKRYSLWFHRMSPAPAMERIAGDLGLIARAAAAEQGDAHAGSLLKAIELLRDSDAQLTLGDAVDALGQIVDRSEHYDGVPVRPPAEAPVRVMNLHQCKGLEAPFVFLVDPSGEKEYPVNVHIDRSKKHPRGYLPIYGLRRNPKLPLHVRPLLAHPADWDALSAKEQQFLEAEDKRLLYVAATRAGNRLTIAQCQDSKANQKNPWQAFAGHLESPPASDMVDAPAATADSKPATTLDRTSWQREVAAIDQRWSKALEPTYAVRGIKESAIISGAKPHGLEPGGAEWGEVLHLLLEAAMSCPGCDLQGLSLSALKSAGLPLTLADEAVSTVQKVMDSQLWQRAMRAERTMTEVPLAMLLAGTDSPDRLPTVMKGVLDLVFWDPAGWVIVDYKSDRVAASEIPALVKYYQPQVNAYVDAWQKTVGQSVIERGLFFTHTGIYMPIDS